MKPQTRAVEGIVGTVKEEWEEQVQVARGQ